MSIRTGYPTFDIASVGGVTSTPAGGSFASKVDDDGGTGDFLTLPAAGSAVAVGFDSFGSLPAADTFVTLFVWAFWSGATPGHVTFGMGEGSSGNERGSSSVLLTTSNTLYFLSTPATSFTSVANLRMSIGTDGDGTGNAIFTGTRIEMPSVFSHLKESGGMLLVAAPGELGDISLAGGMFAASNHSEEASSLVESGGFIVVSG